MKDFLQKLQVFYQQNRVWILCGLGFIIMMQLCNKPQQDYTQPSSHLNKPHENIDDSAIAPINDLYLDQTAKRKDFDLNSYLIMTLLVLLVFVATRKGWIQKLIPGRVIISLKVKNNKKTNTKIAKLNILNLTKTNYTFSDPILIFASPLKKARKFKIKGGDSQSLFPLTLTPETAHQLNINLDNFITNVEGLKQYRFIKVEILSNQQKKHKSGWKLV